MEPVTASRAVSEPCIVGSLHARLPCSAYECTPFFTHNRGLPKAAPKARELRKSSWLSQRGLKISKKKFQMRTECEKVVLAVSDSSPPVTMASLKRLLSHNDGADNVPAKHQCWRISHGLTCGADYSIQTSIMTTTTLLQARPKLMVPPSAMPKKASSYGLNRIYPRRARYRHNPSRLLLAQLVKGP